MFFDLWPPNGQWAPVSFPGEQESWASDLWATPSSRPRSSLRSHLAGALLPRLHTWTALLGAGGVQALGVPWGKELNASVCRFVQTEESLDVVHPDNLLVSHQVTYDTIPRKEKGKRCMVGMNDLSWSLQLDEHQLSAWHNGRREPLSGRSQHNRIGMLLDYEAGTLTYYGDAQTRLHAFHCVFTEELFPACWIGEGVSITLCSTWGDT